jgi:cell shape-determining protein MreC
LTERSLEEKALLRDLHSMEEELTSYQEENQNLLELISCISSETPSKKSKASV